MTRSMTREDARKKKLIKLVQALKKELDELESAHKLQFDLKASLHDKLTASKQERSILRNARHLRDLIEQTLVERDE